MKLEGKEVEGVCVEWFFFFLRIWKLGFECGDRWEGWKFFLIGNSWLGTSNRKVSLWGYWFFEVRVKLYYLFFFIVFVNLKRESYVYMVFSCL